MNSSIHTYCKVGDLYISCQQQFRDIGSLYGYNCDEINDIINQFFIGLIERNIDLAKINNPKAYLLVAFRRKLIDIYRSKKQVNFVDPEVLSDKISELSIAEKIEQLQTNKELITKIRLAYSKLPQRCKQVIYLKFYKDLTTEAIAEQTGLSKRTVYNNLYEGIKLLRCEMNKKYPALKIASIL